MAHPRPSRRDDFEIAIICALPVEYNAVTLLFDEFWDEDGDQFGRVAGDFNNYTTGRIGKFNVVLALLSVVGKAAAAGAAASIRSSYRGLRLALLVGICGGVPWPNGDEPREILLGDVVVSKTVVQWDFGRQYPDQFVRKNTVEDSLSKPNKEARNLLITFETDLGLERLQRSSAYFLEQLQANAAVKKVLHKYCYPGSVEDKLFESSYRHKHHVAPTCICSDCRGRSDPVCNEALTSSCDELGCDPAFLVSRERLDKKRLLEGANDRVAHEPAIHIGAVASSDTVMRSAEERDRISKKEGVIAFEMESAGVWEEVPCVVIKGVSDYADCHKSKKWQSFAAATAAAVSKAILQRYIQADKAAEAVICEGSSNQYAASIFRNTVSHNSEQSNDISLRETAATAQISHNTATGGMFEIEVGKN
ncbi:hypothetical protein S40293_08006 [Stachybotrys chartarum IBT 40293]|nr:hypothetical protein S40293_08006 [Stachybotrys chartarum IBT 40293]